MIVAVFGATGRTGSLVLAQARQRGWATRALVRNAARLAARDGLVVHEGDARSAPAIDTVLKTPGGPVEAVLCTLGMHDITVPATDFSDSVKAIVAGMQRAGVRRIVAVASAGVMDHPAGGYRNQQPDTPGWLAHVSAEHVRNLETLRASGLDWTLMCPGMLVDDIPAGHARMAFDDTPAGSGETGYADLAQAMCDLLADRSAIGRRVGIMSYRAGASGEAGGA
jgi:uncharacterized protein